MVTSGINLLEKWKEKKEMKKILVVMLALAMLLTVVGCTQTTSQPTSATTAPSGTTQTPAEKTVVKVGVLLPLSGSVASQGLLMKMGLDACLEYFNKEVGFKNLQNVEIELVYADSESSPDVGQAEFEKLVSVEKVVAVLGSYQSSVSGPSATLANKYKIPYVIINSISDAILKENANYVFRPCVGTFSQEASQQAWLTALSKIKPIKTLGFVGSADDYGSGNLVSFTRITEALGIEIVVKDQVQSGVADMSGTVQKLKAANVDAVLASLQLNEALLFQKQMKEYKVNIPTLALGGGYMDTTFLSSAGDTAEYVISSSAWIPDILNSLSPAAQQYAERMKQIGNGVNPSETSCNSWLALGITLDALDRAGKTDSESLAKALDVTDFGPEHWANMYNKHKSVKFEDGPLPDGTMMYNQNFGASLQFGQIQNGAWKLVGPFDIAGAYGSATNPLVWPAPDWDAR